MHVLSIVRFPRTRQLPLSFASLICWTGKGMITPTSPVSCIIDDDDDDDYEDCHDDDGADDEDDCL